MTILKIVINKDQQSVFDYIADIKSHVGWMADAKSIELISGEANRVGSKYICDTKVGPLSTLDNFEILKYENPTMIEIFHFGKVSGSGFFHINKIDENNTEFVWEEHLQFPWYMGSIVGKKIAMVLLHNIWRKNLETLKNQIENL